MRLVTPTKPKSSTGLCYEQRKTLGAGQFRVVADRRVSRCGGRMLGLMQDWPLLLHKIIDHAAVQQTA